MDKKRYKFYSSELQRRENQETQQMLLAFAEPLTFLAYLDDNSFVEFTDAMSCEPDEDNDFISMLPHNRRYSDSVYLGEGVKVCVEEELWKIEKAFKK